jgi:hypothetical protein
MIRLLIWLLSQPLLWAVIGVTLGPYFFWRGFRLLQHKRLIMDTHRSTIRAAALGRVEITGKAMGPYTLVAPMSHTDCLYYRLVIESNPQGDLNNSIHEMCTPMFLDDGTGTLMIFPHGSELLLLTIQRKIGVWQARPRTDKVFGGLSGIRPGILHKTWGHNFRIGHASGKSLGEKGSHR